MTQISLSFVVGLSVAGFFAFIAFLTLVGGIIYRIKAGWGQDAWIPITIGAVVLVVTLSFSAWGFFPYKMEYHQYRHVAGTVDQVEARMLASGDKGTTQNYAVRLREDGQTYRCDDSRCSLLKPGDHISLWCIREWQYASTSGYRCRFEATS